jgi:DNA-binding transcriptional ArsR family regulator
MSNQNVAYEHGPNRETGAVERAAGAAGVTALLAAAPLFEALGDPNRLRIVVRLCDSGPSSTSQVTQAIPVTRQAATKHLQLLEAAGLVVSGRRGRERIWTLQTTPLTHAGDFLNQLSRRWDTAIDRLRA